MKRVHPSNHNRQAVVTAAVVIVLIIVTAMTAQLARRAILARRQTRNLQYQQQATEFATAAMQRAVLKHVADRNYTGETWTVPVGQMHPTFTGTAEIQIKDGQIEVVARYPDQRELSFQVTRTQGLPQ